MAVQFQVVRAPEASPSARRRGAIRKEHSRTAEIEQYGLANPPDHFRDVIDYLQTKSLDFKGRPEQGKLFIRLNGTDIAMFYAGAYNTTDGLRIVRVSELEASARTLGQTLGDRILSDPRVAPLLVGTVGSGTPSEQ